jgi:hypothetical protein
MNLKVMFKLIFVVALICCTQSTPVDCTGGTSALEYELESHPSPDSTTDPCQGLICQHTCVSCNIVVTLNLDNILTTPTQIAQFHTLCDAQKNHERISDNFLFQTTKAALLSCGQTGIQNTVDFEKMAEKVIMNPTTTSGATYILTLANAYRSLGKTCDKKPEWKKNILQTIETIYDSKLNAYKPFFPKDGMMFARIINGGKIIKNKFKQALQSDFDYCLCSTLLTQGGNSYQSAINNACQNTCPKSSKSIPSSNLEGEEEEE